MSSPADWRDVLRKIDGAAMTTTAALPPIHMERQTNWRIRIKYVIMESDRKNCGSP
jgi:hypothetical protein